ncbi:centromere protein K isoform X2 [Pogoniulus pusillus]|uniref:centromere protein K isoform X2 n=1 Tax=Pogoniulus pusillus TaxID=488313 RepID=UPI0030B9712C
MAECLPESSGGVVHPVDTIEELLKECDTIWKQMGEYQSKILLQETETVLNLTPKLSLLMMQANALTAECKQWQNRRPELISADPNALLALGKEELQKVKDELEMLLQTVQSKNKQLEEDLKRELQWENEQKEILNVLIGIKEETEKEFEKVSTRSLKPEESKLQNEIWKLQIHKEKLLNAFSEFLEKHFPLPEKDRRNEQFSKDPEVELLTLQDILERLINKLLYTPYEPYVTIDDSFWPPYVELLLRYGIARRHTGDANRMRLEAFHL